jgi:hypothetical protein
MFAAKAPAARLRWMDYARRSMQRIGFVKWLLSLCSPSHTQTLESLTRSFYASITEVQALGVKRDVFHAYVQQQGLHRRYKGVQEAAELQDILLSDTSLPSHSGAVTGEFDKRGYRHAVYVEIPSWATRLHLIRQQNYTLTDRGRVLLLAGRDQMEQPANKLLLTLPEKYILLFCILDADGDFISALYEQLLGRTEFTRKYAADLALGTLQSIRSNKLVNRVNSGQFQEYRRRLDKAIEAVKKQSGEGLGPRESIVTPRLEPLVDCGLLMKPYADRYEYVFTDWGRSFFASLVSADSISEFLGTGLAAGMAAAVEGARVARPSLSDLNSAYSGLKSGIGYVPIQELALLASAQAIASSEKQVFEITATEQLLREAASKGDRYVRFALGRMGGPSQVRIDSRAFS